MIFLMTILPSGVSEYWVGDGAGFRQGPPQGPRYFPVSATDRLPYGHWRPPSSRTLRRPSSLKTAPTPASTSAVGRANRLPGSPVG